MIRNIYQYEGAPGEVVRGASMTVPNESMSLKEILARSFAGATLPDLMRPDDDGPDEDFDDAMSPDVELSDFAENRDFITKMRDKIEAEREKAEKEAEKKAIIAEYEAEKSANSSAPVQSLIDE